MTEDKLGEIYDNHANDFYDVGYCFVGMQYEEFVRAVKDYEAEKAKETCKWKDASTYSIIHPNKKIAPLYVSPHLSKIEGQGGCFISKQDLSNYEYCPYPGCGKPIEVIE